MQSNTLFVITKDILADPIKLQGLLEQFELLSRLHTSVYLQFNISAQEVREGLSQRSSAELFKFLWYIKNVAPHFKHWVLEKCSKELGKRIVEAPKDTISVFVSVLTSSTLCAQTTCLGNATRVVRDCCSSNSSCSKVLNNIIIALDQQKHHQVLCGLIHYIEIHTAYHPPYARLSNEVLKKLLQARTLVATSGFMELAQQRAIQQADASLLQELMRYCIGSNDRQSLDLLENAIATFQWVPK